MADAGLHVLQATVETDGDLARDTFHLTNADGGFDMVRERRESVTGQAIEGKGRTKRNRHRPKVLPGPAHELRLRWSAGSERAELAVDFRGPSFTVSA